MPVKNVKGGGIQIHAYTKKTKKNKKGKKSKLKKYLHGGSHNIAQPGKEVAVKTPRLGKGYGI